MSKHPAIAPSAEHLNALMHGYKVTKILGFGGMGAVYHAVQDIFQKEVAIKLIHKHAIQNPELIKQFYAEALSMAILDNEHIIKVYDSGEVEGMPYIIMEYVPGTSLFEAINGYPIEPLQAAEITLQICKGLIHAHEEEILHRDIKPENIMITPDFKAKIADFGLSRDQFSPEKEEVIWGSPGYVAPEVIMDPEKVDHRTDVYSVGCVLYAMLTGAPPNPYMLDLTKLAWCDFRFTYLIQKSMAHNQEYRYSSCEAFAEDLIQLIHSLKRHNATGATPTVQQPPSALQLPPTTPPFPAHGMKIPPPSPQDLPPARP
jgi:serine/threonine protein kinase